MNAMVGSLGAMAPDWAPHVVVAAQERARTEQPAQAAVVQRAHDLQPAQHAEDAVVAAAADLGVEVAADGDRRQRRVAAGAAGEDVAQPVDLDRAAGALRPAYEEVAHLLVLGRQRQPAQPDLAEAADLGRALEALPQPLGIDLQDVGDHATLLRK